MFLCSMGWVSGFGRRRINSWKKTPAQAGTPTDEEIDAMNGSELLRLVDMMHRDRNIPKDVIFEGIEAALQLAAERAAGITGEVENEPVVTVHIDRVNGQITA